MTREARKKINETGIKNNMYNNFPPLQSEIECAYITLVMKNLNAGAKFSQNRIYLQIPRYGERRTYRLRTVA